MRSSTRFLITSALLCTGFLTAGCPDDGPAEEAGEKIDRAVDKTGDALEDAADEAEDALDEADVK